MLPISPRMMRVAKAARSRALGRDARLHTKTWAIIKADQGRSGLSGVIYAKPLSAARLAADAQWSAPDGTPTAAA
jgi:hypothetical protein